MSLFGTLQNTETVYEVTNMSMDKHYYVIAGYDLTAFETEKYRDWKWTDEGEDFLCNQSKGRIQLFDDPEGDRHLYLGFILAAGDEWNFETVKFDMADVNSAYDDVTLMLYKLQQAGVVNYNLRSLPTYQVIAFEECR